MGYYKTPYLVAQKPQEEQWWVAKKTPMFDDTRVAGKPALATENTTFSGTKATKNIYVWWHKSWKSGEASLKNKPIIGDTKAAREVVMVY